MEPFPRYRIRLLRKFTMASEGLMRDLVHPVTRTESALIDTMVHARGQYATLDIAENAWRLNCVKYKGNVLLTKAGLAAAGAAPMPPSFFSSGAPRRPWW